MSTALLLGATGETGKELLKQLAASSNISKVIYVLTTEAQLENFWGEGAVYRVKVVCAVAKVPCKSLSCSQNYHQLNRWRWGPGVRKHVSPPPPSCANGNRYILGSFLTLSTRSVAFTTLIFKPLSAGRYLALTDFNNCSASLGHLTMFPMQKTCLMVHSGSTKNEKNNIFS